ncbi:MAG: STAS/SEC14 domain-containing protein [Ornithinimicrobium sp.]
MASSRIIDGTDIVAIDFPGRLHEEDLAEVRELVRSVAADQGQARLMVEYTDADADQVDAEAVWSELARLVGLEGAHQCAVITDAAVADVLSASGRENGLDALELFAAEQRDDALFWLRE